jgi:hypothetical protein
MRLAAGALVVIAACGGKGSAAPGPAGEVVQATGSVTATRAGAAARALAAADTVFSDDTIATGADGAVLIRLAHNGAVWSIGPGESRRVDQSAAWRAPKGGGTLFAGTDEDRTVAAGRHDEDGDENRARATLDAPPTPAPAPAPAGAAPPPDEPDRERIQREVEGAGILKMLGSGDDEAKEIGDVLGHGAGGGTGSGYGAGAGLRGGGGPPKPSPPGGQATIERYEVAGSLDEAAVERAMRTRLVALRRCHEHELKRDPGFEASLTVSFTVAADGRLSPIEVSPDDSASLTACLKGAIRAMRLPESAGETTVTLGLRFAAP